MKTLNELLLKSMILCQWCLITSFGFFINANPCLAKIGLLIDAIFGETNQEKERGGGANGGVKRLYVSYPMHIPPWY